MADLDGAILLAAAEAIAEFKKRLDGYEQRKPEPGPQGVPGADGKDGADASPEAIAFAVAQFLAPQLAELRGADGAPPSADEIVAAVEQVIAANPDRFRGRDGAPGKDAPIPSFRLDRAGDLWVVWPDGKSSNLGRVRGADGRIGGGDGETRIVAVGGGVSEARVIELIDEHGGSGSQGPPGPPGPQGPAGPQGPQGEPGATGATGPAGADGEDGADGAQGPQGIQGIQGVQGPPGADGADGADGAAGPAGPAGPAGADGANGMVPTEMLALEEFTIPARKQCTFADDIIFGAGASVTFNERSSLTQMVS